MIFSYEISWRHKMCITRDHQFYVIINKYVFIIFIETLGRPKFKLS